MLMVHLIVRGWLVNTDKIQGAGLSTKYTPQAHHP